MFRRNTPSSSHTYSVQTYTTHSLKSTSEAVTESLRRASETVSEALSLPTTWRIWRETETGTGASASISTETEGTAAVRGTTTDGSSNRPVKAFSTTVEEITKLLKTVSPENIETRGNVHDTKITENPGVLSFSELRVVSTSSPQNTESVVTTVEKDGSNMWTSEAIVAMGWMSSAAVLVLVLALLICIYMWKFVWTKSRSFRIKNKKTSSSADKRGEVTLTEIRTRKEAGIVKENRATKMG